MAYNEFAYFYDEFNEDADYQALFQAVKEQLHSHGIQDGIVVDLGCGTGDLTLMLSQAGYDMIGVDLSEEMLAVLREKAAELEIPDLLLLNQNLLELDLFGTIRAAVSTFDTFNHIGPLPMFEKAIEKAAFFMEKDGVFLFDVNTPYKHKEILGNETFVLESEDALCVWKNQWQPQQQRTAISIEIRYHDTGDSFEEEFFEYCYELEQIREICKRYGLRIEQLQDGEDFGPCRPDSQRWFIVAVKEYTQTQQQIK